MLHTESVPVTENEPLADGDRVDEPHADCDTVKVGEPEEERQRDAVGLPLGHLEGDGDAEAQPLGDSERVPHPEALGEADDDKHRDAVALMEELGVPERHRVTVAVPDGLPVAERHRVALGEVLVEAVGERVAATVADAEGDTEEQPLPDSVREGVVVPLPLPLLLRQREAVGDADPLPLEDRHREGEG